MDVTQEVGPDTDPTDDETGTAAASEERIPGPPSADRIDVRRRVMALRRW